MTENQNPLPKGHPVTPERLSELARYLFGQDVQWSKLDMLDYDNNVARRLNYEARVAEQIRSLDAQIEKGDA